MTNFHKQYDLPSNQNQKTGDFELSGDNILKTAKNLSVKDVFFITDREVVSKAGQRFSRVSFSGANYTLSANNFLLGITSLAIAPSIGLPLPSMAGVGKTYIVKDEVGGATTTTITVSSDGEKTIDGSSTSTLTTNYQSKSFYTDGNNWFTY